MATLDITPAYVDARNGRWRAVAIETMGGAYTALNIRGRGVGALLQTARNIKLEGMTLYFARAGTTGGVAFEPVLQPAGDPSAQDPYYFGSYVTTRLADKTVIDFMGIPITLSPDVIWFILVMNVLALDVVRISLWGTYEDKVKT